MFTRAENIPADSLIMILWTISMIVILCFATYWADKKLEGKKKK